MFIPYWIVGLFLVILVLVFIRLARASARLEHCEEMVRNLEGLPKKEVATGDGDGWG